MAVTGKGREINEEDVHRVIEAAKAIVIPMDREVIHVIPQEFIVDDQGGIKDPIDMIGIRLESEVHIITGSVTSAQNVLKCVNRAGFKVQDIVLQSLASAEAVLSRSEKELGVLLVDLGEERLMFLYILTALRIILMLLPSEGIRLPTIFP